MHRSIARLIARSFENEFDLFLLSVAGVEGQVRGKGTAPVLPAQSLPPYHQGTAWGDSKVNRTSIRDHGSGSF